LLGNTAASPAPTTLQLMYEKFNGRIHYRGLKFDLGWT